MELGAEEFVDLGGANTTSVDVRAFYSCWLNFTTRKEFAWADKYHPKAAPDRKTRRLMEEENSKVRAAPVANPSQRPRRACGWFLSRRKARGKSFADSALFVFPWVLC
jgi:DnaJ family protein A protein 5